MLKKLVASALLVSSLVLVACSSNTNKGSSAHQTEWERIKEAGTLRVATPGTLYPTSYHDDADKLIGYEIDMLNEIGKRLDIKVDYQEIGVAEAFTAVDSGKVDIAVNNFDTTKERLKKYNFSIPYKYSIGGMIVREDGSSGIEAADLSDWKGKKAGGGAGTQYMKIAEKLGAEPVIYDNVTNDVYLRDVSTGRTDFIPNDYYTQVIAVKYITQQFPDIKVKMGTAKYNPTEQGIVMSKADTSLKEKLDEVLKEMKEDGTLKAISEKYYAGQDLTEPEKGTENLPVIDTADVK
ncbi:MULTISPECIES: transporter substrate-binding domain-containing protein [unclassified Streptococcus]|uniref:transporter substrate-binding domain-containing protein n=1 Tax=unclassified Streptococcus TaxID=2608887 RepID=UPI0010723F4D|nr:MULTISPECIES: transporter substrate-binding domain-containing protein [unclassified Streptococcus]MBF0787133.1 transporter substrate-binding domain-containing protein [Streptococcus sp. 19428wC2_LYSM12]MCQ9211311.1 transporter substrate-binding domain-containing protein [Streptococcus sp. B01]MCQ9214623.1 transporter substrate-binding domain-containing protein [Streptococcus sp. O1]TFV06017.1 transporter substrate-binding domain-containing protein [Streptococcus sp. LYSM12]